MKFCADHWEKLRDAIKDRGLYQFVAKDGEEGTKRMVSGSFEPLMGAHNAILSRALDVAGLNLMMPNEDGSERCPLCYMQAEHDAHCKEPGCKQSFETWIGYAADDAKAETVRLGLIASA